MSEMLISVIQKVQKATDVGMLKEGIVYDDYVNIVSTSFTWDLQAEVALAANIGHRGSSSSAGDALLHPTLSCHFDSKSTSCWRRITGEVKDCVIIHQKRTN